MTQVIRPTPYQSNVLMVPEDISLILAGGRGGGKSFAIAFLVLRHCQQYGAKARVLITRRRLKSLLQFSTELLMLFKSGFGPGVQFNQQDSMFRLPNGATVQMAHAENASAISDVAQGMNFSLIVCDEVGEGPSMEVVDQLGLSLRAPGVPLRMILAGNPGGQNHGVLSQRYIAGRQPFVPFEFGGNQFCWCPSTLDDNPHLPDQYKRNFEVLRVSDPALYEAMRWGRWDKIVGDFFQGVWREEEMVIDHHHVPPDMFSKLSLAIDWGSAAPMVALLMGTLAYNVRLPDDRVLPKGSVVVYDEHAEFDPLNIARGTGRTPSEIAPKIIAMCARNGVRARGVIDAAAEAKTAGRREASISDLFRESGVRVSPAKKGARVPRFEHLKQLMVQGEFYVARRCTGWLRTVPSLPRDPRNPEDVDTRSVDHWLDACSYGLAGSASGLVTVGDFSPPRRLPDTGDRVMYV